MGQKLEAECPRAALLVRNSAYERPRNRPARELCRLEAGNPASGMKGKNSGKHLAYCAGQANDGGAIGWSLISKGQNSRTEDLTAAA